MAERYKIRVTKDHLVFCSGHFISYEGDQCERLHGHNYRTAVEVEGDLDENSYVFDFIALKHRTKAITDELDHRMLLPTGNTTAELLARYIGRRLLDELRRQHHYEPRVLRVEVEENIGQSATYEWRAN